jgi:5-methylcytosine-specific restriction protein B
LQKFRYNNSKEDGQIAFVTFHQSYGYEEFIEGLRPVTNRNIRGSEVRYKIIPGVFKKLCGEAAKNPNAPYVIVIDEINRGNISKIFGELITLIEEDKRGDASFAVTLPYSNETFSVPSNVYIIGTMNTADRSLTQIDTALRRRFEFTEMMPEPELLKGITVGEKISIGKMLETINQRITVLLDREHTIGHSFFLPLTDTPTIENLAGIFRNKIIPLLQEYFYDDYEKIRLVLGDNQKDNDSTWFVVKRKRDANLFGSKNKPDDIDILDHYYEINQDAFEKSEAYEYLTASLKTSADKKGEPNENGVEDNE